MLATVSFSRRFGLELMQQGVDVIGAPFALIREDSDLG